MRLCWTLPSEYPQYNRGCGYYAVFFADPDGLKMECVFTPNPVMEQASKVYAAALCGSFALTSTVRRDPISVA